MWKLIPSKVDPTRLLHRYNLVISDLNTPQEFIAEIEDENQIKVSEKATFANLLEGMRFKHYMYTSCI